MKNKFLILFALGFFFNITSCKKDDQVNVFTGYRYYPTNIGHEIIYNVDSIVKSAFNQGQVDTFHFQVKEVIADTFPDNEGRSTLRIERFKRLTSSDPWVIYKVWTANVSLSRVEKDEDNNRFIKLIFPPSTSKDWNGNALNNLGEQMYEITDLNVPDTYNGLSFDSTLTVLQNDVDDVIEKSFEQERYATGVGMYYKKQFNGQYKQAGGGFVLDGYIDYREEIISYKN